MLTKNIQDFKAAIRASEGRLLGLDMGSRKIGIALSDTGRMIATPYETLQRQSLTKDVTAIGTLIAQYHIQGIVVGWPVRMDGTEGDACTYVRTFVEKLQERYSVTVLFQDERFSTAVVQRVLNETNLTRKKKDILDDKMAAGYILQGVLDQVDRGGISE